MTMAAKEEYSINKDSDIFYDFCCTLCEKDSRNVEAIKRCNDCRENLCGDCLVNHNKFKTMQGHSLVDKQGVAEPRQKHDKADDRADLPSVKCGTHPGNMVELYCENHDDVGCATCGNIRHKLCKDMQYIPDVATGIKATSEPRDVADSLATLGKKAVRVKHVREEDLKRVTTQRDTAVQSIEQRIETIKQRLDDLKVDAITEVDGKFKRFEQTITRDINRLHDVIRQLDNEERRLKAAQDAEEPDLFVYVKQGKAAIRENEKVVQELVMSRGQFLHVTIDETVLTCVSELETFVNIGRPAELALSVEQNPTVGMTGDKYTSSIADCCFLANGDIVMTDQNNDCVKLFDKSFKALDRCAMQHEPRAVCEVGVGEVAMTLIFEDRVQFATVDGKIHLTRSFSLEGLVGKYCRGMSFSNNLLFISCGGAKLEGAGRVRIYDTSGALLQTIKHGTLDVPYHNMATENGGCIVAHRKRGVVALDKAGNIAWQYQHADLKHATGICDVDDWVLVCCYDNSHVFQVNPDDQSGHILLRGSTELDKPRSLTYDAANDKLLITKKDCDHVLVYKINRK